MKILTPLSYVQSLLLMYKMSEVSANVLYALLRSTYFSEHFSAYELIYSHIAAHHGLLNLPNDPSIYENLREVANFLEHVRRSLGHPIVVNSGFRSAQTNKLVGGVSDSYHLRGLAVDISVDRLPLSYYMAALEVAIKETKDLYDVKVIPGNGNSYIHIQLKIK